MLRKEFIKKGIIGGISLSLAPKLSFGETQNKSKPLKNEIIKEFVIAGHFNLEKVQSMLHDYPNLIHSRFDWGKGDFEEAIEGAAHKGNKDVANYLIGKGARVNLFTLTMLGKTELVKPVLEAYPEQLFAKGPHGLTLLHHAEVGGRDAKDLYNYFLSKGLTKTKFELK